MAAVDEKRVNICVSRMLSPAPSLLGRAMAGGLHAIVLIGLLGPILMGLHFKLHSMAQFLFNPSVGSFARILALAIAVVPFGVVIGISRSGFTPSNGVLAALLASIFLSRWAFTSLVDNELISDYRSMWEFASRIVSSGTMIPADSIPELRTYPFFLPAAFLSNGASWGYELANSLAVTLIALLLYLLTSMLASRHAGLIALILFAFAPEPLFAVETATHDIPGTLLVLASVFAVYKALYRRGARSVLNPLRVVSLALLCGGVLVLLEVQRNIGVLLLGAIIVCSFWHLLWQSQLFGGGNFPAMTPAEVQPAHVLIFVLVATLIYAAGGRATQALIYSDTLPARLVEWRTTMATFHAQSESVGDYADYVAMKPYLDLLTVEERGKFTKSRSLSDIYHNFGDWPRAYARKTMRLYNLSRQGDEYFGTPTGKGISADWDQAALVGSLHLYSWAYVMLLLPAAFVGITWFLSSSLAVPLALLPAVFLAILTLALGISGEIQSRYLFPAWAILPLYIGVTSSLFDKVKLSGRIVGANWLAAALTALLGLAVVGTAYFVLRQVYGHWNGRMIERSEWVGEGGVSFPSAFRASLPVSGTDGTSIRASLGVERHRTYAWRFFSSLSGQDGAVCRLAINVRAGERQWDAELVMKSNVPALWTFVTRAGDGRVLPLAIQVGEAADSDGPPACVGMMVEFGRLTEIDETSNESISPSINIKGPAVLTVRPVPEV